MDINIIFMLGGLMLLHCLFALRAFKSKVDLSTNKKWVWCLLSLILGPMGYYGYHGFIPLDRILKD
ncbi:MAG: hypothetical protein KJ856_19115 [Gammaproteobacteria bacterium]|uniref:hypothetical protein n=1 Tax=Shewanella TaxID=22 RepID=UPI000CA1CB8E|nr:MULTISPECIES: hypothetical protein [Shewanella]EGT3627558.1 hypothetical protein [Morganella morganii]MBU1390351.1 hypothetical protein [Gammaproteobacteria bacterium]QYX66957.1 hypothetical protein K2227_12090 [Shewanella putrefaciens]AUD60554.1 hypothetical protein AYJ58_14140 [Shewanella sp. Pdp11]MBU1475822.1 hypothetical protein [Gammaproteobacteria bacterium]